MAEIFIAWNQNYNRFIDFIDNHIRRTNPGLIVHVFVEKNIAKKDCPRDLQYVVQHQCLTNSADSAETHLIAYLLRNYLSDEPDERTVASQRKLVLLLQTRPGQHEELLMLLSEIPGFSSRNFARIYQIDEELNSQIFDDERKKQDEFLEGVGYHSQRATDHPKRNYPNLTRNYERQEAGRLRNAIYRDPFRNNHYNRGADHLHRSTDQKQNGETAAAPETSNHGAEKFPYAKIDTRRGANDDAESDEREMQYESIQNTQSKRYNEFEANYEKHRICEECLKNIRRHGDFFAATATRRTWPNTRSGRGRREERMRACGICMEKFHCHVQAEDEIVNAGIKPQDSFESFFEGIGNLNMKSEADELRDDNTRCLEHKISSKPRYVPWGRNITSKCSCSDTHICTACFIKRLEPSTINMNENINSKRDSARERPDTSPAALHGSWKVKKQIEISRGEDSDSKGKISVICKGEKDIASGDECPVNRISQHEGYENNSVNFEEEPKNNGQLPDASDIKENRDDSVKNGMSADAEEYRVTDSKELQSNLERLLAQLEAKPANSHVSERANGVDNKANEIDQEQRSGRDVVGNEQSDSLHESGVGNGFNPLIELVDEGLGKKNGSSSRISSYDYNYDKKHSSGIMTNGVENQSNRGPKTPTISDNAFEYDIFDELGKKLETESTIRKGRKRDKYSSNQSEWVDKDGRYVCKFCPDKKFSSANVWKIHMKNSHKKCNCPCGNYFETREDYLAHFYKLFPLACFLERKCPERFRSLYFQAVHHRERHFSERPFYCVQCFDAADDKKSRRRTCFKDIKSLRIHAESMGHDPKEMFLISSQSETDIETLPWSMKCTGIDFC